jgi:hypothetical protein
MQATTENPTQAGQPSGLSVIAGFGVWSPIETAPRGETVLLYVSNAFGHKHVKTGIAYPTNHPDLEIVSIFDDGDSLGYLPEKYARYWMPLPPSPNH